jgi:RNA polymerase sigma-70 factor (ECF subfamily)
MAQTTPDSVDLSVMLGRLNDGDPSVVDPLIQHSCQRLERLAHHMLCGYPALRRWVETDDVLQNALVRLLRALEQVRPTSARHYLALAATQIRRELVDLARHYFGPTGLAANHQSRNDSASHGEVDVQVADLSHEPSTLAQWCELHEQIGALPDKEREVVSLVFYQGLSQEETAATLDISVRTVQRRWHDALTHLHAKLRGNWPSL